MKDKILKLRVSLSDEQKLNSLVEYHQLFNQEKIDKSKLVRALISREYHELFERTNLNGN